MNRLLGVIIFTICSFSNAAEWGVFEGVVEARWLPDHRNMELLRDFKYIDPKGVVWLAPKGSIVNGASIPQVAWSIIGGPYEGAYRNASVIHDVACVQKNRRWQDVHRAFFTAMKASDIDPLKAKIMYAAVYHFGPRWGVSERVVLPSLKSSLVGSKVMQISAASGPGTEVVIASAGKEITRKKGFWRMGEEKEIVGAIVEVRDIQPVYSEKAFRDMELIISEKDLSIEEIEALSFTIEGY